MLNQIAAIHGTGVAASTTSYESIATVSGTGSSSIISFASIPTGYKHLQLRYVAKSTSSASYLLVTFNGASTGFKGHYLTGDGASATAGVAGSASALEFYNSLANTTTGVVAAGVMDILDYLDTNKYKTVRSLAGTDYNGSGGIWLESGLYMSTSAIASMTITANAGNFTTTSQFALYGIKG